MNKRNFFLLLLTLIAISLFWIRLGLSGIGVDTDFGRDLSELSKLWMGQKVLWLGPVLSPGLHASPLYYYFLYPALLIGKGNPYALIIENFVFAFITLFILGYAGIKRYGTWFLSVVAAIGLSPWISGLVLHPGNGYTYVLWLLLALTSMWFSFPILFSSLFLGIAISFHPAAIFALPLLVYQWVQENNKIRNAFFVFLGLLLPWSPIILFEIITKGYILRHWLQHPSTGITFSPGFMSIPLLLLIIYLLTKQKGKGRFWLITSFVSVCFFMIFSQVPGHYVLGAAAITLFTLALILIQYRYGKMLVIAITAFFVLRQLLIPVGQPARPIQKLQRVANYAAQSGVIQKNDTIAVVAALDKQTKVPQADDYRFFLRVKGFRVLDVTKYNNANKLLMFVEDPTFHWKQWSTWEIDQIGKKKIIKQETVNGIRVIIFEKL